MGRSPKASPEAERLRVALDLYEMGEQMVRHRIKRLDPDIDASTLDTAVVAWRLERPGAPLGDSAGRPSLRFT